MEEDTNEEEDFAVSENDATLSRTPPGANVGKAGIEEGEKQDMTPSNDEKEKEKEKEQASDDKGEAGWEPVVLGGPWKDMVDRKEPPDNGQKKSAVVSPQELDGGWSQLKNLQALYEQGFITVTEYKERKSQIVDTLTGTRSVSRSRQAGPERNIGYKETTVINKPPPDFTDMKAENAIKYTFDVRTGSWAQEKVQVKLAAEPFARGGLRKAYHLLDLSLYKLDPQTTYVAKMSIDPFEDREIYFQDAEMQMYAREWAEKFNSYNPPKKIEFIKAWLLELVDRPGSPICGVEPYIAGPYRKHNNNFGYVSDDERNTPQAFSHFTYEASGKTLLLCDIQGVNDLYTDPQIHNREGVGFGKGNLGERGFEKFLSTHRCNHICRYLKLPSINAKVIDAGTKAPTTIMSYRKIDVVNVHEVHMQGPALHIPHTPHMPHGGKKHPNRPTGRPGRGPAYGEASGGGSGQASPAVDPRAKRKTRLLTVNSDDSYDDTTPLMGNNNNNKKGGGVVGKAGAINNADVDGESGCCCIIS